MTALVAKHDNFPPHLCNGGVDLQDLLMTFDLPNTDLTRELIGCWTVALQRKGTLQRSLVTAPHLREGEFLSNAQVQHTEKHFSILQTRRNCSSHVLLSLLLFFCWRH